MSDNETEDSNFIEEPLMVVAAAVTIGGDTESGNKIPEDPIARLKRDRAQAPNRQFIDEVRIKTVPRFKTSWASGDEWRFSATTELLYKGRVFASDFYGDVQTAIERLPMLMYQEQDKLHSRRDDPYYASKCDQEGCAEEAVVWYECITNHCNHCGKMDPTPPEYGKSRAFCANHSRRGNCSLTDADDCYRVFEGEAFVKKPHSEDVSKSQTIFVGFPYGDDYDGEGVEE